MNITEKKESQNSHKLTQKRVLYTIATGKLGIGGHFFSLKTLIDALDTRISPIVVGFGTPGHPVLANYNAKCYEIKYSSYSKFRELTKFIKIAISEQVDVIHAFDIESFGFARIAAAFLRRPVLLTVCGGKNPSAWYPRAYLPKVDDLILFSKENLEFYKTKRKYKKTNIMYLPNRVREIKQDKRAINKLKKLLDKEKFTVLRIGRIVNKYSSTNTQAIELVQKLNSDNIPTQMVFIGQALNEKTKEAFLKEIKPHGILVDDDEITQNASSVIDIADVVVGTGRSLMEAASRKKLLLTPLSQSSISTIVTRDNWEPLFHKNFSERSELTTFNEQENYDYIKSCLTNKKERTKQQLFARELYDKYFSIDQVISQYQTLYESIERSPAHTIDSVLNWLYLIKHTRHFKKLRQTQTHITK